MPTDRSYAVEAFRDPSLTLAIALTAGVVAQSIAIHLRIPGIVILLATGVLLGPDVLGVVWPDTLGPSLAELVGFAVAIILFEGGMNLDVPRIQRAGTPIRRLLTVGAVVTAVGATLAVRGIMQWPWDLSVLFGTLVIVTGPTVVTPLLKRLRLERGVETILEAEGVLIDPIGAIVAIVALEVVLHPTPGGFFLGIPDVVLRLGVGVLIGVSAAWFMSRVLRVSGLIPEVLTNVFMLSAVYTLYQLAELAMHESGIASVTAAGIAVRYLGTPVEREVREFKEQLTMMFVGLLFVLLAADIRLAGVRELGWPGIFTVLTLMFVVRPLTVVASTMGTGLSWRQRAFIAWTAPRGIVAAAVASLFAVELERAGMPGGEALRGLVFLVIAVTVVVAGLSGASVAWLLDLRRPTHVGWVILGAHALARKLAHALLAGGEEVVLVDVNADNCRAAEAEGIRVIHGNALQESVLDNAQLDTRLGAIGLTRNEEVNFLFIQTVRAEARLEHLYVSLSDLATGLTPDMVHKGHAHILFGGAHDVERWADRIEEGVTKVLRCTYEGRRDGMSGEATAADARWEGRVVALVFMRNGTLWPVGDHVTFRRGDEVVLVIESGVEAEVIERLGERGFVPREATNPPADAGGGRAARTSEAG